MTIEATCVSVLVDNFSQTNVFNRERSGLS